MITKMIWILLTALYAGSAHAWSPYSCPAEDMHVKQFREMTRDMAPQDIPAVEQGDKDLKSAPKELQELAKPGLHQVLNVKDKPMHEFSPFVHHCCPKKTSYNCTYVFLPLRYIWYRGTYCHVVYPAIPRPHYYVKCTCCTCVRQEFCPMMGRCVEAGYSKAFIVAYCPRQSFNFVFVKLAISIPRQCRCMAVCPGSKPIYTNQPQPLLTDGDGE